MVELLTAAQMRAIEKAAIDSGEVTGLELMERAGQGVVEAIFEEWPELDFQAGRGGDMAQRGPAPAPPEYLERDEEAPRTVVLCGPGNNGGDGFVVARLLHERGWTVEVFLYGDAEKLPPDARVNYERWLEVGAVDLLTVDALLQSKANISCRDPLLVDALFGTGLSRPLSGDLCQVLATACSTDSFVFAKWVYVDIVSGLCSDSGLELRLLPVPLPEAALTVSFHAPKLGHFLAEGALLTTRLFVADIGLESDFVGSGLLPAYVAVPDLDGIGQYSTSMGHKYSHGHALILSGGPAQTGAARLAARGALRIGAGLVTLGVPPAAQQEAAAQMTAIMLRRVSDAEALEEVLKDERINALCIGPALGLSEERRELVAHGVKSGRPVVLDADALTLIGRDRSLFAMLHDKCVLTPHAGEFARLFPDIAEKLNETPTKGPAYSKVDATREAAARAGCVVLFKGPDTVIADPSGQCAINSAHYEREAPWLATAGSGDVLAGFITGLLARGFGPMKAAETAAWLHVECARKFGPGLIAEDIPEQLPAVFRDLGL